MTLKAELQEALTKVVWPEALPEHTGQSAVLLPICITPRTGAADILLIKRAAGRNYHQKQIAFPGGHCEAGDADSRQTALREAHEEIGLLPDSVDILGRLPLEKTVRDVLVFPWVGLVQEPFAPVPNPQEVDRVLFLPFERLRREGVPAIESPGPYRGESVGITVDGELVWGLTGRLLKCLWHLLSISTVKD